MSGLVPQSVENASTVTVPCGKTGTAGTPHAMPGLLVASTAELHLGLAGRQHEVTLHKHVQNKYFSFSKV